ncbi:ribonuclease P protein subunit p25-like protein [Salarias fasciatus]|uniref:DNA/RNA-binding protein Alba-like domain-containing protein n=1 Tax=Salarias fasciatus TaxID=181472 RepID=A0A672GL25_SALFA|nr:ribonuclease P protein subunit p25-like protein [Salarias fasciatus]XP_029958724.1 ribonuclease P protein subunit p25-like protein [Salarias fasciatus]
MENYSKARTVESACECPFSGIPADTPQILVKDGSKIRNLLRFALSRMEAKPRPPEEEGEEASRQLVFTASGKGVAKAITCVEMVKRRVKGLHQLTRLAYRTVVEVWEPLEPDAGLDSLTVNRNLPAIWILLTTAPLDPEQPGYQPAGRYDTLWALGASREVGGASSGPRPAHRRKRGGGGGGGGGGGAGSARGRTGGRNTGRTREAPKGPS